MNNYTFDYKEPSLFTGARWRQNCSFWRAFCSSLALSTAQLLKQRHRWTDRGCGGGLVFTGTAVWSPTLATLTTRRSIWQWWSAVVMGRGSGCQLRATSPCQRTSRLPLATSVANTVASCATESSASSFLSRFTDRRVSFNKAKMNRFCAVIMCNITII